MDVEIILIVYVVVKTDFIPFLENDFLCHNKKTCFVLFFILSILFWLNYCGGRWTFKLY